MTITPPPRSQPSAVAFVDELISPPAAALAGWTVTVDGGRPVTARGKCPICRHSFSQSLINDVTDTDDVRLAGGSAELPPEQRSTELFKCHCRQTHLASESGGKTMDNCGRRWLAVVVADQEQASGFALEVSTDTSALAIADALADVAANERASIAASAEKWLGGVTALYGLFGLTGIAVAKDSVESFGPVAKACFVGVVALGLVAAATATVFGYLAAYGWPKTWDTSNDAKKRVWFRKYQAAPQRAAQRLKRAVASAVLALAALLVATGIVWLAPAGTAQIKITTSDDSEVCGKITRPDDNGSIVIVRDDNGTAQRIAPSDISKVTAVNSC